MTSAASIPNPTGHPARFSGAIVDKLRTLLLARYPLPARPFVFDPLAGTGERLAELLGDDFEGGGVELQRMFIVNRDLVKQGDATRPGVYPKRPFVIVTSPVYPNGIADSYDIGEADTSYRPTYTAAHFKLGGGKLHPNNMGRYGYRGTKRGGRSIKRAAYWDLARRIVVEWTRNENCVGIFLNVSDFKAKGGTIEPLVADWRTLLRDYGWKIERTYKVRTPRNNGVEHADQRVEHESIIVAVRP